MNITRFKIPFASPKKRWGYKWAIFSAFRYLRRRKRVARLAKATLILVVRHPRSFGEIRTEVQAMARMVLAWARGEYRDIPWRSLVSITASLLYFINPLDLIPDTVLMLGFVDDVAVFAFTLRTVEKDLQRFLEWEASRALPSQETEPTLTQSEMPPLTPPMNGHPAPVHANPSDMP